MLTMEILQNIPFAILGNIAFLAVLFIVYTLLKHFIFLKPSIYFILGVFLQIIGALHFCVAIQYPFYGMYHWSFYTIDNANTIQIFICIGILYCCLFMGYILHLGFQMHNLKTIMRQANYTSTQKYLHLIAPFLTHSSIQVGFLEKLAGPMTFGWLKPIILLPFSIGNQLSTEEIKYILLHEIAHIQRNDYFIQIFVEVAHAILFFNPFSYYFRQQIQIEREKACDDWVIQKTKAPLLYSKALFKLATVSNPPIVSFGLNAFQNYKQLLERIQHLNKISSPNSPKLFFIKLISSFIFIPLFFFMGLQEKTAIRKPLLVNTSPIVVVNNQTNQVVQALDKKNAPINSIQPKQQSWEIAQTTTSVPEQDSSYHLLVQATMHWIKERSSEVSFTNVEEGQEGEAYSIAEKLLLRTILQKYALKKAILENALMAAENQNEALEKLNKSSEWKSILQYEKWAKSFLKYHPDSVDTLKKSSEF